MLDILKRIAQLSTEADKLWAEAAELRKSLASNGQLDNEAKRYVTISTRLDKTYDRAATEKLEEAEAKLYRDRAAEIYQAQLRLQEAEEAMAQVLTTPELEQLREAVLATAKTTQYLQFKPRARQILLGQAS